MDDNRKQSNFGPKQKATVNVSKLMKWTGGMMELHQMVHGLRQCDVVVEQVPWWCKKHQKTETHQQANKN